MREELIQRLDSEERTIRTKDLLSAQKLLVTNSVQEVLPARLVEFS
jgi:branched-subunit amino acid aminotransferase/4-amino-4-deoxychorismate lyase